MPPCALAELLACSEPLVASATRAPARSAETAAARPEAPLPITSTSKESAARTPRLYLISRITYVYPRAPLSGRSPDRGEQGFDLLGRGRPRVRLIAGAPGRRGGNLRQILFGHAEIAQTLEAGKTREYPGSVDRIGPDRRAEAGNFCRHELPVE